MEKIQRDRKKKSYISGYRIFKEEKRTDKRNRFHKAGTEGRDNFPAPIYPKKVEYTEAYLSKNLLLSRL